MRRHRPRFGDADCMSVEGVVVAARQGHVDVEFAAPVGCRSCEGTCMWRRLPGVSRTSFSTSLPLKCGDSVSLSLPDRFLLAAAALVYGLPLLALLAGALLGVSASGSDLGAVIGAVAAVAAAGLLVPKLRRRLEVATLRHLSLEPVAPHADANPL